MIVEFDRKWIASGAGDLPPGHSTTIKYARPVAAIVVTMNDTLFITCSEERCMEIFSHKKVVLIDQSVPSDWIFQPSDDEEVDFIISSPIGDLRCFCDHFGDPDSYFWEEAHRLIEVEMQRVGLATDNH